MSERLDYLKNMMAAAEAAGLGCCEDCGAGMTAVELPDGKFRQWFDHAPDCPQMLDAGVFTVTLPEVLTDYTAEEIAAQVAAAKATVAAENRMPETDRLEEFRAKIDALTGRYQLCPHHDHGHGPAAAELMNAIKERFEYVPEVDGQGLNVSALPAADIDLLIELCDRLAIAKGKRWNAQFELRAAKGRNR